MASGILGFRIRHQDKITFVIDTKGLYSTLIEWSIVPSNWICNRGKVCRLKRVVGLPTEDQILDLSIKLGLEPTPGISWYDLLRSTHGKIESLLNVGMYIDYSNYFINSPNCKNGYILNFDRREIEVYERNKGKEGRYFKKGRGPSLVKVIEF